MIATLYMLGMLGTWFQMQWFVEHNEYCVKHKDEWADDPLWPYVRIMLTMFWPLWITASLIDFIADSPAKKK